MIKAAAVLVLASALAACATSQQPSPANAAQLELRQKVIGKWREDKTGVITEYFPNGTMNMTNPTDKIRGSNTIICNWKVLDDIHIELYPLVLGVRNPTTVTMIFPQQSQPDVMLMDGSAQRRVK